MPEIAEDLLDSGLDLRRGTFTMTSNYLYDEVVPKLNHPVEKLILFLMERKTVGFHRDSARVSVEDMMDFTGASRSTVRRARRELIKAGYLVVLKPGTGLRKTGYTLDFEPERHKGDATEDSASHSEKIIQLPEAPVEKVSKVKGVQDESVHAQEESAQDPPEQAEPDSAPENADKPNKIKGVQYGHPSLKDLKNTGSLNKKTDKDTEIKNSSATPDTESRKKVVASVCSSLRSFGFKVERHDYAFVSWCCKQYGVQALKEKLRIMKLQLIRGVKLINPFGWLRAALARDFQYSH